MTFGDVLAGQAVFVDANIFVYALAPEPIFGPPSFQFLERIRRKEIEGFTSCHILSNVAHRLMSLEACATLAWPIAGIANRLKRHPPEVASLHRFRESLREIIAIGIHVLPVSAEMSF